jgi:hypothetical protein
VLFGAVAFDDGHFAIPDGEEQMPHTLLLCEHPLITVAALFGKARDARHAACQVARDLELPKSQVNVLVPGDPAICHPLVQKEPAIVSALVKSRSILTGVWALLGLSVILLLVLDVSPYFTLIVLGVFAFLGGLLARLSMRPDEAALEATIDQALHEGQWVVVVQSMDRRKEARTVDVLEHSGGRVVRD